MTAPLAFENLMFEMSTVSGYDDLNSSLTWASNLRKASELRSNRSGKNETLVKTTRPVTDAETKV